MKEGTKKVNLSGNAAMQQEFTFEIDQPHLWNGRQDPFLYQVEVTLSEWSDGRSCHTTVGASFLPD